MSSPVNPPPVVLQSQPVVASSTPAFLSRFPRSLSSLSLGGKKKSLDRDSTSSSNANANASVETISQLPPSSSYVGHLHHHPHIAGHLHHIIPMPSTKSKFTGSTKDLKSSSSDQPPPLPQRNFTRRSQPSPTAVQFDGVDGDVALRRNTQISDLDHSITNVSSNENTINNNSSSSVSTDAGNNNRNNLNKINSDSMAIGVAASSSSANKANKKRSTKAKIKANSDPKISSQLLIQMEKDYDTQQIIVATGHSVGNEPPPLPPRQPGMLEENQNFLNNNKFMGIGGGATAVATAASNRNESSTTINSRPSPNSLDTLLNYPLIATCTAVRDNITSAFPLSHRPNIVQQLQQSSNSNTANMHQHHSTTSSTCNKSTVSNFLLYCHIHTTTLQFTIHNSHDNYEFITITWIQKKYAGHLLISLRRYGFIVYEMR